MKVGDLVKISCNNRSLNGKIGTVMLHEENYCGIVYCLCVMIEGKILGFEESEVEVISESR
jgi:hypothetical protein